MNFAQVRSVMGQKDEKGFDVKIPLLAVFADVGGTTLSSNKKPTVACVIVDDQGEKHKVHFYGNNLPSPQQLNQRSSMSLSAYIGQGNSGTYTGYRGFWNADAQTAQASTPQAPVQTTHQIPQIRPGSTISAQTQQTSTEDRIVRGNALNAVFSAMEIPSDLVGNYLAASVEWIKTGRWNLMHTVPEPTTEDYGPKDKVDNWNWESPASDDDKWENG